MLFVLKNVVAMNYGDVPQPICCGVTLFHPHPCGADQRSALRSLTFPEREPASGHRKRIFRGALDCNRQLTNSRITIFSYILGHIGYFSISEDFL